MSKMKLALFVVAVLFCISCAGAKKIVKTVLASGEHVIENAEKFMANSDHQKVITEMAIEVVTGTKISTMDVVARCAVNNCHSIKP